MSLEDIVHKLVIVTLEFPQDMKVTLQNLENHVSNLSMIVGRVESQGKLSS